MQIVYKFHYTYSMCYSINIFSHTIKIIKLLHKLKTTNWDIYKIKNTFSNPK